jgi:peptidylprolyl isomerase
VTVQKPTVAVPTGPRPDYLDITDLVIGDGPQARRGDRVLVHYVGVAYSSGREFDASHDRGEPLSFTLGAKEVISGWDMGVAGMRVGGRRQLVIPPHLGYGDYGAGSAIAPGETLIFVVDLVEIA